MARRPGQPVGDDNVPAFPSTTAVDDDVEGHLAFVPPVDEERQDTAPERHATTRPDPC